MKKLARKLEELLEIGGIKKDIIFLAISGKAVILSLVGFKPFVFDMAWVAIILCGLPIVLEAIIGLVTSFDIKADVPVSMALIASICIGEDFAAGEVAFIMQLAGFLALADTPRAESKDMIDSLARLVVQPLLLTGDHENAAKAIAAELHITQVQANCLPEDKLAAIGQRQ